MAGNLTYILLSRSILDSEVFASQKLLKIWIWCLVKARYKDTNVPLKVGRGERVVKVKRGQFIFGRFKAEEQLFIDGSTIYKLMKRLELLGNISIKSNNQYSIVTILNYDIYQNHETYQVTTNEQPSNNQVTTNAQPSNTYNTVKKDNKDNKKYVYSEFYDSELKKEHNPLFENYIKFLFGDNEIKKPLTGTLKIRDQLKAEQFEKLLSTAKAYNKRLMDETLIFENGGYYKKKLNLYLSLNKWLKNEKYS